MNLSEYTYLWDSSDPGWVLYRFTVNITRIYLLFASDGPTLSEIAAIRSTIPQFGDLTAGKAIANLKGKDHVDLGEFRSPDAEAIMNRCAEIHIQTRVSVRTQTTYLPTNELKRTALIIEDDQIALAVAQEAIRHGVPVRDFKNEEAEPLRPA